MIRIVVLTIATLVALPLNALADEFDRQVQGQMTAAVLVAAGNGYALSERIQIGSLGDGARTSFTFDVRNGVQYMLVADCDADCADIDLVLSEINGREIAADRDYDDIAVVGVPAGHPGIHRVTVSMASCSVNPCRFGLGLFTRESR